MTWCGSRIRTVEGCTRRYDFSCDPRTVSAGTRFGPYECWTCSGLGGWARFTLPGKSKESPMVPQRLPGLRGVLIIPQEGNHEERHTRRRKVEGGPMKG